jgi:hypothetical protein
MESLGVDVILEREREGSPEIWARDVIFRLLAREAVHACQSTIEQHKVWTRENIWKASLTEPQRSWLLGVLDGREVFQL